MRAGARKLFEQHLYPIMAPHQQALFVPPAYGCNDTACANIDSRNVASVQFAFDRMYVLSARRCANTLCCSNSTRDGPNPPLSRRLLAGNAAVGQVQLRLGP